MGERLDKIKQRSREVLDDPDVLRGLGRLAEAATEDVRGRDGEVKVRKVLRRALRPTKTVRRAATRVGREARDMAREEGTEVVRERGRGLFGRHLVAGESHDLPNSGDDDFWEQDSMAKWDRESTDETPSRPAEWNDKETDEFWAGEKDITTADKDHGQSTSSPDPLAKWDR